jgi:hypothetical protein
MLADAASISSRDLDEAAIILCMNSQEPMLIEEHPDDRIARIVGVLRDDCGKSRGVCGGAPMAPDRHGERLWP